MINAGDYNKKIIIYKNEVVEDSDGFPVKTEITRDMLLKYNNKIYTIEYLNNVDEANIELEIQAKVVDK